jgi:hypothetical protein
MLAKLWHTKAPVVIVAIIAVAGPGAIATLRFQDHAASALNNTADPTRSTPRPQQQCIEHTLEKDSDATCGTQVAAGTNGCIRWSSKLQTEMNLSDADLLASKLASGATETDDIIPLPARITICVAARKR